MAKLCSNLSWSFRISDNKYWYCLSLARLYFSSWSRAILKRNSQEGTPKSNSVISFDGLNINEESHEVYVNGVEINLTALEFKLLKHLLDRRGRVQTRDQLLEEVWGYSSHVTTRTVDTHVKRLREKLKEMGKHIQTIRGVGYRFSRSSD